MYEKLWTYQDLPKDWKDEIAKHFPLKQTKGLGPAARLYTKLKKELEALEKRIGDALRAVRSGCAHPLGMLRLGSYCQDDTYGCNRRSRYVLFCTVCGQIVMQGGEHNGGAYMLFEVKGKDQNTCLTLGRL